MGSNWAGRGRAQSIEWERASGLTSRLFIISRLCGAEIEPLGERL